MKKANTLVIRILLISLGVLLVVYFTFNRQRRNRYQWAESYQSVSDQPYGTSFIQKLLASYRPGQKFTINDKKPLHQVLDSTTIKMKTDYVLIGQDIFLSDADRAALLNFISSGNDAFIATINLPFGIVDSVFIAECDNPIFLQNEEMMRANLNFYNINLKSDTGYTYVYHFREQDLPYFWNTLNPQVFCDATSSLIPLGYIGPGGVNFFKFSYGKGNLFIHTNPLVFTNYFLTKPEKAEYASRVFSHLGGEALLWDEFSKSDFAGKNNAPEISPIAYLLQHESLRYAWWLMLAAAILYTIFTAKRRQRVIPVLEAKANTSLEFIHMISALHFQHANHLDIGRKKMKYFYYWIRAKYGISTHSLGGIHLKRLAEKAKINPEAIQLIADEFKRVENQPFYNESNLVDLHNALERFYTHCK